MTYIIRYKSLGCEYEEEVNGNFKEVIDELE